MKKGIIMFLIIASITILVIILSIFAIQNIKINHAHKKVNESIQVGDNEELEEIDTIQQKEIKYDDTIGMLTIPDILLDSAPIKESTELDTLKDAIGHFTSTNIYAGNVGLASHNSGNRGDYFRNLNKVKIGSEIYYQTDYGTKRYVVETKEIIEETDFSYLKETEDNRITLITCVINQPTKRLCVQAIEK